MSKKDILDWINKNEGIFTNIAKNIWENPQLAYDEDYASQLQIDTFEKEGFHIQPNIGGIPTAFVAEYGNGSPIIGILGEFDALPGLSQTVSPTREEIIADGPGHGCGHHLLGTAGVEAVIALKEYMKKENIKGTIRYYGCPAEEVLSGKTYMAREGVFDDLDCCLTWHPGTSNFTVNQSMQAMVSIEFEFTGITAHAAAAPHAGRSALDAVELMNVGTNYMREHVLDGSRIHYVITNGGLAPNVVPDQAKVWYYLRAATKEQVNDMLKRVKKIADGAVLMTETEVESTILAFAYETLPNETLNDLMYENMMQSEISFTKEEESFASHLLESINPEIVEMSKKQLRNQSDDLLPTHMTNNKQLLGSSVGGSTDVGDVSWITPTGMVMTTCAPVGVQAHTWQATSAYGSSIGYKGMHLAAKTMALTLYDLFSNEELVAKAKEEFKQSTIGKPYTAGIPDNVNPPVKKKVDPVLTSMK
ncbi:amidohydrolase [Oceanobacillus sp. 1P07AA]|uniref:amidohydrolase n=1 Tax=Oceanobacillus sp. 1P07AA TaxID=3132293 RepID=UPI0039A5F221